MIRIVTALAAEARPLIERYRLQAFSGVEGFRIFRSDAVALVVSGPGKANAAAATAFLHATTGGRRNGVWLNVGTAGHARAKVGTVFVAHKIRDRASGAAWYPPLVVEPECPTVEVVTVDRPEETYPEEVLYEMEASGFYATATRFSTGELVHTLKIVSDNASSPVERLSADLAGELVGGALPVLDGLVVATLPLATELERLDEDPPHYRDFLAAWHFTVSENHRLRELLARFKVLGADPRVAWPDLARRRDASEVLRRLRERLESLPVTVGVRDDETC